MIESNANPEAPTGPVHALVPLPFAPYYEQDGITIYNADCRKVLPWLDRVDLLLTDPPYGLASRLVSRPDDREWGKHCGVQHDWDLRPSEQWVIDACVSVADDAIIWGGNYYSLPPSRCWLTWDKKQEHTSGHFEMAWTTIDSPTRTYRLSRVEAYSRGKVHPTQKPAGLMQWCLSLVPDAETVLDPFMGSGTTLVAARLEGRKAIGIEISEAYCEKAAERLRQRTLF